MKILSINYPKSKPDVDKITEFNRNYHAMLEKSVKAENRMINLDKPDDFGSDGGINHKAEFKIQFD